MTEILDKQLGFKKQKYTGLALKHHIKGIYIELPLYSSHKSKNMMRKLQHTSQYSLTFVSTSNVLIKRPLQNPGRQIAKGVNSMFSL